MDAVLHNSSAAPPWEKKPPGDVNQQEHLQRGQDQFVRWYSTTFGTAAVAGSSAAAVAVAPAAQPAAATNAAAAPQQPLAGGWPACWEAARLPRLVSRLSGRAICYAWGCMSHLVNPLPTFLPTPGSGTSSAPAAQRIEDFKLSWTDAQLERARQELKKTELDLEAKFERYCKAGRRPGGQLGGGVGGSRGGMWKFAGRGTAGGGVQGVPWWWLQACPSTHAAIAG